MRQPTQGVSPRKNSRAPPFKTASMKAHDSFDGTQAHKLRGFIQSCQLIFHNDPESLFSDRKKVLYSTSFLTDRSGKWIEPYLSNISNEDPSYLLNNWQMFETQLFTLFGDPNENLNVKNWGLGGMAYLHIYRRVLASRLLDQLASHPSNFDTLQELMDITVELDIRKRVVIKRRILQLLDKILPGLLNIHIPRIFNTRRARKGIIFRFQRISLMLLPSMRTINQLALGRRVGLKNVFALIVVESTKLENASRGLRIGQGQQEASLTSRKNPEKES
ncbi:hypothetical protein O181_052303 [Austropuccinia psidii MF-1]|uniref:Retrotransposon gag domain-containing protein n=1 Tax=Austropuccinia psidii MF-1 TaxID=1389203 RepID=A0A9Q3HP80_9BASI|nr:hypothetical protein [Austropuccinia psidii MF-1]